MKKVVENQDQRACPLSRFNDSRARRASHLKAQISLGASWLRDAAARVRAGNCTEENSRPAWLSTGRVTRPRKVYVGNTCRLFLHLDFPNLLNRRDGHRRRHPCLHHTRAKMHLMYTMDPVSTHGWMFAPIAKGLTGRTAYHLSPSSLRRTATGSTHSRR